MINFAAAFIHEFTGIIIISSFLKNCINTIIVFKGAGQKFCFENLIRLTEYCSLIHPHKQQAHEQLTDRSGKK